MYITELMLKRSGHPGESKPCSARLCFYVFIYFFLYFLLIYLFLAMLFLLSTLHVLPFQDPDEVKISTMKLVSFDDSLFRVCVRAWARACGCKGCVCVLFLFTTVVSFSPYSLQPEHAQACRDQ